MCGYCIVIVASPLSFPTVLEPCQGESFSFPLGAPDGLEHVSIWRMNAMFLCNPSHHALFEGTSYGLLVHQSTLGH